MKPYSIIVAMAQNGIIGRDQTLPWRLPEDLQHFKKVTWGHPIVMGRKTYESIGRALPGRHNLVLSRNPTFQAEGVQRIGQLEEATRLFPDQNIFIIGGAELYRLAWPQTGTLFLTRLESEIAGDTYFPYPDWENEFTVIERSPTLLSKSGLNYSFIEARRKAAMV